LEAILNSFLLVAVTEMGDKTQLLAFILASRFRKPWAIFAGILVATILNHLLAASAGTWIAKEVPAEYLKWILGLLFIAFAGWILIPDQEEGPQEESKYGAFLTTVITFFLAEMGDKTQLSTVALAAKYQNIYLVTFGTTLGMMFSDGLAVFFGDKITQIVPMKWVRIFACALFVVFGLAIIVG
jgi:putative Ca2+/H+ antiporter (TMEM165/GDT1 family)